MAIIIVLLVMIASVIVLAIPLGIAMIVTRDPNAVLVYRAVPSGPDDVEGAEPIARGIYRGHMRSKMRLVAERVPVAELPFLVRSTAATLRFVVCAGMVTVLPILGVAAVELGGPLRYGFYGIPGIILTFGHLAAQKRLLRPRSTSGKVARIVGAWTIVHNVALLGGAYFMASTALTLAHASEPISPGLLALLGGWALFGIWLGSRTIAAGTALDRWIVTQNVM